MIQNFADTQKIRYNYFSASVVPIQYSPVNGYKFKRLLKYGLEYDYCGQPDLEKFRNSFRKISKF